MLAGVNAWKGLAKIAMDNSRLKRRKLYIIIEQNQVRVSLSSN